jgi:xanthine dehydrogenase accessory factor
MSSLPRPNPIMSTNNLVLIRGGGDLATGVALRLHRAGIRVVITELAQPLAVRRAVSFSEAVYDVHHTVEDVEARLIEAEQFPAWLEAGRDEIPVLIDPDANILLSFSFPVVVDARLTKQPPTPLPVEVPLHIGLGPGFAAGRDCHAVIETRRSHTLGRVYWTGTTQPDSGQPEGDARRVLRAPGSGMLVALKRIGEHCEAGEVIASIEVDTHTDTAIHSPFLGVLRGLIRPGLLVQKGMKIGDVDARDDESACYLVSDKSLAIGGAVLEAILSQREIRELVFS